MSSPMQRLWHGVWQDVDGTAVVEAAILLPVLLILVYGALEFSWIVGERHTIDQGLADAARYIAHSATPNDDIVKRGARLLATTGEMDGGALKVRGWSAEDVDISYTVITNSPGPDGETGLRGGNIIETVTVSTSLVLPSLGFLSAFGIQAPQMIASHSERVIGSD